MFKTQNNQPTLANQQPLDEIELMSGQEMVNVVGGENSKSTEQSQLLVVGKDGEALFYLPQPQPGTLVVGPSKNPPAMATPAT